MNSKNTVCWCCGSEVIFLRHGGVQGLTPEDFQITDQRYGATLDLYQCKSCKFIQADETINVLDYYKIMEDPGYEETAIPRKTQARALLKRFCKNINLSSHLDVGAGSGILVEVGLELGLKSLGVEPSLWLFESAKIKNIPVLHGTIDAIPSHMFFDYITLIDVVEHVTNPLELILSCKSRMSDESELLVVTPNKNSIAARVLGKKWWHFRIAHVGYFDDRSAALLFRRAGFKIKKKFIPGWYFPLDYLFRRLTNYIPLLKKIPLPRFLSKLIIPLNLYDSKAYVLTKTS